MGSVYSHSGSSEEDRSPHELQLRSNYLHPNRANSQLNSLNIDSISNREDSIRSSRPTSPMSNYDYAMSPPSLIPYDPSPPPSINLVNMEFSDPGFDHSDSDSDSDLAVFASAADVSNDPTTLLDAALTTSTNTNTNAGVELDVDRLNANAEPDCEAVTRVSTLSTNDSTDPDMPNTETVAQTYLPWPDDVSPLSGLCCFQFLLCIWTHLKFYII